MEVLRSIFFNTGLWLLTIVFSILTILLFFLPPVLHSRFASTWAYCVIFWLKWTCGLTYRVEGIENIPNYPCIILSKHQSAWETIAFQVIFPPQIWVMKKSLLRIPFLGWAFWALKVIAINRLGGQKSLGQLAEQGKECLKQGRWVVIFPEGTRVPYGEKGKYHIGGAWLAVQASTVVLPVAHNAGKLWEKNAWQKKAGEITVVIGKPINPEGMKAENLNKQVENWIEKQMEKL